MWWMSWLRRRISWRISWLRHRMSRLWLQRLRLRRLRRHFYRRLWWLWFRRLLPIVGRLPPLLIRGAPCWARRSLGSCLSVNLVPSGLTSGRTLAAGRGTFFCELQQDDRHVGLAKLSRDNAVALALRILTLANMCGGLTPDERACIGSTGPSTLAPAQRAGCALTRCGSRAPILL